MERRGEGNSATAIPSVRAKTRRKTPITTGKNFHKLLVIDFRSHFQLFLWDTILRELKKTTRHKIKDGVLVVRRSVFHRLFCWLGRWWIRPKLSWDPTLIPDEHKNLWTSWSSCTSPPTLRLCSPRERHGGSCAQWNEAWNSAVRRLDIPATKVDISRVSSSSSILSALKVDFPRLFHPWATFYHITTPWSNCPILFFDPVRQVPMAQPFPVHIL